MSDQGIPAEIEYEIAERPMGAIIGAMFLPFVLMMVGFVPVFVGFGSERRDPGGGYIILGAITGLGHIVIGLIMLAEMAFIIGTGRGRTISRLARSSWPVHFTPGVDFMLGAFGVGFGTIYMLSFTQTIADMPRLPTYAIGYTLDGWLGVWIVWMSVLVGCFFWALWADALLGRDPVPRRRAVEEDEEE